MNSISDIIESMRKNGIDPYDRQKAEEFAGLQTQDGAYIHELDNYSWEVLVEKIEFDNKSPDDVSEVDVEKSQAVDFLHGEQAEVTSDLQPLSDSETSIKVPAKDLDMPDENKDLPSIEEVKTNIDFGREPVKKPTRKKKSST